jgi:Holliday junction DNA helicase RuvA
MYAYLNGKFTMKSPGQVHLDVHGVGYEVHISLNTYSAIQQLAEGRLYTHLQVKEDAHVLFGFFEKEEKDIFLMLISISGVGAATARMMLSSMKPAEIATAIQQGNVKLLESVKGIGKKTAERMVLELKDRFGKYQSSSLTSLQPINTVSQDALQALTSLGIAKAQAEQAIQRILKQEPDTNNLETLIKKSLQSI